MGLFDSSNALGGMGVLILPFCIALLRSHYSTLRALLSMTVLTLALPVALFSGSRTALLFCLFIMCWHVYIWMANGLTKAGRIFLAIVLGGVGLVVIIATVSGVIEAMLFGEGYGGSTMYRYFQYIYGAAVLVDSPIFGFGYARNIGEIVDIRPLDSFYLRVALEGGVVAFLSLLGLIVSSFRLAGRVQSSAEDNEYGAILRATRISIAVAGVMAIVQSMPQTRFYLFLWIGLVLVIAGINKEKQTHNNMNSKNS